LDYSNFQVYAIASLLHQMRNDEMLPEYHLDYHSAKPNRFAAKSGKQKMTVVVLEAPI